MLLLCLRQRAPDLPYQDGTIPVHHVTFCDVWVMIGGILAVVVT